MYFSISNLLIKELHFGSFQIVMFETVYFIKTWVVF